MTNRDAERLRRINAFPQLVAYLREELQWPFVAYDDWEEIAFEWSAEELGIEGEHAAAIEEIRQLQPPDGDWPWGIFYVKFEKKRLPITILRRALASVVRKKRATANPGQRWDLEDLLFISSYGEGEKRQISFARFQAPEQAGSRLPVLKVLAWDEDDTDLSLEHTAGELRAKLVWPDDASDVAAWRSQWGSAFTRGHRETIKSSKDLARELAGLAQRIRDRIIQVLSLENEAGPLRGLMEAFRGSLVHDLNEPGFADMYAQTIAYGLFSARVTNPEGGDAGSLLSVPVTNPFLKELLGTFLEVGGRDGGGPGIDFDELGVNDVVDLLDDTDMEAVLRDFGDRNPLEDPVIHFFEGFLGEYDKKIKKDRGVFYTPRPVVSFIVRSVDELLRTEFGLEDGLADTTTWGEMAGRIDDLEIPEGATATQAFVQILDPATGTGTFLVEVIDLIHNTMTAKWQAEGHAAKKIEKLWNDYVPEHLLPRLHGYELMMAPYAIAHMKIGLKLHETGYRFESDERARVYLTNALEPAQDFSGTLAFATPALAHEAEAVNAIKRDQRFTVVIGNPPYSASVTEPKWLMDKLEDWKRDLEEKKTDLNREEWKFLRLGKHLIDISRSGVVGHIINRDFLDGITKRGMRADLQNYFTRRLIYDLNGDVKGNVSDDNVFDIQQGVSVVLLCKSSSKEIQQYASLVGSRSFKYEYLISSNGASKADGVAIPAKPYFSWVPGLAEEDSIYNSWAPINSIFGVYSSGIETQRDRIAINYTPSELWGVLTDLNRMQCENARTHLGIGSDGRDWTVDGAKRDLADSGPRRDRIIPMLYRPFDRRFTYWTGKSKGLMAYPRRDVMRHLVGKTNLAIMFNRQVVGEIVSHFGVTRIPTCKGTFYLGNKGQDYLAPLFLYEDDSLIPAGPSSNISPTFLPSASLSPEQSLAYIYAVCSSATYRHRYGQFLKRDFPRIPEAASSDLAGRLASVGAKLVDLHLMEAPVLDDHISTFIGSSSSQVEKVSYSDETVWIDKAKTRGFKGVPEEVWNFHIGGYQVCEKWLKDRQAKGGKNPRPGRVLTDEDIEHYQKIVVALSETIRIMGEIDEVIEVHGGWPGAFQTDSGADEVELGGASLAADAPAD